MTDWIAVSDSDLEREYRARNEKVKLQVVALTADRFRDKVTVSDADVTAHFDAHKAEYRKGEQRKIRYLLIDRDQLRAKVTVRRSDVEALLQVEHSAVPDAGAGAREPHPAEDRRQGRGRCTEAG